MRGDDILYHASNQCFNKFDDSKIVDGARGIYGWGFYFTDSIWKALDYGRFVISIDKSELNIKDSDADITEDILKDYSKIIKLSDASEDEKMYYDNFIYMLKKYIGRDFDMARKEVLGKFRYDANKLYSMFFKKLGYDGFKRGYEYVIFNFDKIKILECVPSQDYKK